MRDQGAAVSAGRRLGRDDGAAAVEFALVSVLLLTLLFGIIQYAYYFYQSQAASSTVREASRLAAVGVTSCPTYLSAVRSAARNNGLGTNNLIFPPATTPAGTGVTVSWFDTSGTASSPTRGGVARVRLTYKPTAFGFAFVPFISGNDSKVAETRVEDPGTYGAMTCP